MQTLENNQLRVKLDPLAANLCSLFYKPDEAELMWNGKSERWEMQNPVLFPIIASIPNDKYLHDGIEYFLPLHGFSLHTQFYVENCSEHQCTFYLESDQTTREKYPFDFQMRVIYTLKQNTINCGYQVKCTGDDMYFNLGGHPTFNCPIFTHEKFTDYYIEFSEKENIPRYLMEGPLMNGEQTPLLKNEKILSLDRTLFKENAIILKDIKSDVLKLRSKNHPLSIVMQVRGIPHYGIFSYAECEDDKYICIEPWHGLPGHPKDKTLTEKEGIIHLSKDEAFSFNYDIAIEKINH